MNLGFWDVPRPPYKTNITYPWNTRTPKNNQEKWGHIGEMLSMKDENQKLRTFPNMRVPFFWENSSISFYIIFYEDDDRKMIFSIKDTSKSLDMNFISIKKHEMAMLVNPKNFSIFKKGNHRILISRK